MGSYITLTPTNILYEIPIIHSADYLMSSVHIQIILKDEAYCSFIPADTQCHRCLLGEFVEMYNVNYLEIRILVKRMQNRTMLPNLVLSAHPGQCGGWSCGSGHVFDFDFDQSSHFVEDSCLFINHEPRSVTLTHSDHSVVSYLLIVSLR